MVCQKIWKHTFRRLGELAETINQQVNFYYIERHHNAVNSTPGAYCDVNLAAVIKEQPIWFMGVGWTGYRICPVAAMRDYLVWRGSEHGPLFAATAAALAGLEDFLIQTLGCWHSSAILRYMYLWMSAQVLASNSSWLLSFSLKKKSTITGHATRPNKCLGLW